MQGQQSAIGSLPEVIDFDHGSTSSDTGFDQQMCWTSIGNSAQSRLPDYLLSSSDTDTNMGHQNAANCQRQDFCGWDFGESSSRAGQDAAGENDQKSEHDWSAPMNVCTGNMLNLDQQYQSSNGEDANHTLFVHNSESQLLLQDLNMNIEADDDDDDEEEDDDCQVLEYPHVLMSDESRNEQMPFASSSSNPFGPPSGSGSFLVEQTDGRPECSFDSRRLSCKRKTLERNARQPSEGGSTSNVPQAESSLWLTLPAPAGQNASNSSTLAVPEENGLGFNLPEQVNPRHGLSFGQVASDNFPFLDASGTRGSSRRNFRLRINAAYQPSSVPNSLFSPDTSTGNTNVHSSHHSLRLLPPSNLLDLRSGSAAGGGSTEGQSVSVNVSSLHTSSQSWWSGSGSLRDVTSTSYFGFGAGNSAQHEASSSRRVPRIIADYPMFVPPSESRSSLHNAPNWGLAGRNVDVSGNVASTSRSSSGAGAHSASPSWVPHRSPSQYPVRLRLAEYVSRSLATDPESGGQNGICLHPGSSSSQEIPTSSGSGSQGRHSHSRSAMLLERRIDGSFGIPYSMQTLAAASGGRSRLVSEMRNVLDLVRRGEGLRFEDVMMLDQSVIFGMADIHDRHRDMRLDVDNMSYEELLALEERIGNVSTGLCEESILKQLKQQKYVGCEASEEEIEPCCICQEAYCDGEVLGLLECGHDFHTECIKRWLMNKNVCPICKTTGLTK